MNKMKEKSQQWMHRFYDILESSKPLQSVRGGLVMLIPILLIGSVSLVLKSLPIPFYQDFIQEFLNGALYDIFTFTYNGTMGVLAVYVTAGISICYSAHYFTGKIYNYGPMITSLICFLILSGVGQESFEIGALGAEGMFTAVVCSLCASGLYCFFDKKVIKRFIPRLHIYADGADGEFNRAVKMTVPIFMVVAIFVVMYQLFRALFKVNSVQMLLGNLLVGLFDNMGRSLGSMLLFSALTNILWFFGLHGNDILEPVCQHLFVPAIEVNQQLIQSGGQATEIYSKTFFDVFALMGGTGNAISLLLAVLLFSKRRSNRRLASYSAFPMLFNVSEMMLFGLPVVLNPVMLIPFVLTGVVLLLFSAFVISIGLVPIPVTEVGWTTPVLLGGYMATGSVAGAILQVVNIFIGVMIYCPFVKMYDEEKGRNAKQRLDKLVKVLQQSEAEKKPVELLAMRDDIGAMAKSIAEDLRYRLEKELPTLHYQPQYNHLGKCIGAEALLRWDHPIYGRIFPPLVVKLAEETGILTDLEKSVFRSVVHDMRHILKELDTETHISVNVTGVTIQTNEFEHFLKDLMSTYPEQSKRICIEITEQAALNLDEKLVERLTRIHELGYSFAIDDFSMGSTSIKYLQTSVFDLLKLDGSLVRDMMVNTRSRDIIASITDLTKRFGIQVLAEYVEDEEQRAVLEKIGCFLYQGYLYSPAVPADELMEVLKKIESRLKKREDESCIIS